MLRGTTTLGESGPGINSNNGLLNTAQSSRTGASSSNAVNVIPRT